MRLVLIRHGETNSNALFNTDKQVYIGALDGQLTLLNDNGKEQARLAKGYLDEHQIKVDEVISSDLMRTKQTSRIIFPDYDIKYDERLRERHLGVVQGMLASECNANEALRATMPDHRIDNVEQFWTKKPEFAENYEDVLSRLNDFLSELDFKSDMTVALVAHFHTIRVLSYALRKRSKDLAIATLMIENSKPYIFDYNEETDCFECINSDLFI